MTTKYDTNDIMIHSSVQPAFLGFWIYHVGTRNSRTQKDLANEYGTRFGKRRAIRARDEAFDKQEAAFVR